MGTTVTTKTLVVLAEKEVEILVDSRELLEPSALKIFRIDADIRNVTTDVVVLDLPETWEESEPERFRVKVIIQGILHKQIFWVGKHDNTIHHMQVNVPFSTFVLFTEDDIEELPHPIPGGFVFDEERIQAQIWDQEVEAVVSNLISPNRLIERVLLGFVVKLEQLTQLPVVADIDD